MSGSPNWMLYALIGLVIIAAVGAIIHFTSKD
jgi:hypothetical protein